MQASNLIAVFKRFPKQLFRVNNGRPINLRVWSPRRHSYDIFAENGLVKPKALDPLSYAAPNGASMRPNSPYQQSLVSWRFRGSDMVVYSVPKGTRLPDDLVLVHERSDHYSLQPAAGGIPDVVGTVGGKDGADEVSKVVVVVFVGGSGDEMLAVKYTVSIAVTVPQPYATAWVSGQVRVWQ
ncbi:hypothetical protein MANI_029713 [Metarhizium anisopliae]|nr:hypothetical protein MANI_029713 [Metarhizium anisopliae]